ncbi:MAG TPA: DeoR/GlpR family DNA-binding transcription regulator [Pusillimonas sp.]
MWLEARHQRIQALIDRLDRVTTDQVIEELGVSRETVRRDFLELEAQGMLKRVHGGAVRIFDEPSIDKRIAIRVKYKQSIVRALAQRLNRELTVFLDAGSTTTLLARELARLSHLTIITNSFDVVSGFTSSPDNNMRENRVFFLGGDLSQRLAATTGASTIAEISRFHVDMALLSPVAVDAAYGATSFDHNEALIARAMAEHARQVVVLADYSKIGIRSRESYCDASRIDLLVTNNNAVERPGYKELAAAVRDV